MSDPDLGPLFRASSGSSGAPTGQLDADAIITRSRRRRLPRLVVTTAVPIIAVAGLLGGGIYGLSRVSGVGSASSVSAAQHAAPVAGVPADGVPSPEDYSKAQAGAAASCAVPQPYFGPTTTDLAATVSFPDNATLTTPGVVTLTNTSSKPVSATSGGPAVTIEDDGAIVALSFGSDSAGRVVDLKPGASMKLTAYLPARCSHDANKILTGPFEVEVSLNLILNSGAHEVVESKFTPFSPAP
jgi:hypothetical protein